MIQQGSPLDTDQILHAQHDWEFKLGVSTSFQHVEMTFFSFSQFSSR